MGSFITAATSLMPDLSAVDFSGISTGLQDGVKTSLPIAIGILGLRKGIAFLMSTLRKA